MQHATRVGGSVISLKELIIDAIASGIDCHVWCLNKEVAEFYRSVGAKTSVAPMAVFNHNTAFAYKATPAHIMHFCKQGLKFFISLFYTIQILRRFKPQIIHLNSSVLFPYLFFFKITGRGTIIHIREFVLPGRWGIRRGLIRKVLNRFADFIFYISEVEFNNIKTREQKSIVVYNYVHTSNFFNNLKKRPEADKKIRIITLGGVYRIKGGDVILEAFSQLDNKYELLILGSEDPRVNAFDLLQIEGQEYYDRVISLLNMPELSGRVTFAGRVPNPNEYLPLADALIFWAQAPHFPRPVFEGWLSKCPIIYFNPGFINQYITDETVDCIKSNSVSDIRSAIEHIGSNTTQPNNKVEKGYHIAIRTFTEQNFKVIETKYNQLFNRYEGRV
jgi:glycosyltransferase involved in cell wall biosynthesis